MDMEELWSKTREVLRAEVNAVVYNSLLGSNNLVPALLDGDTLVLRVVMDNLKLLITNQWYSTIVRALSQVAGHQMDVEILTQEEIEARPQLKQKAVEEQETVLESSVALNPKYTFETFVVGSGNRFAHAAALSVATDPAHSYNPLFIYGGVGLGKTHLMRAIQNYIEETRPSMRTVYVDAQDFVSKYSEAGAIKDQEKVSFRNFRAYYEQADILLLDDVQHLQGKKESMNMLFQLFNTLTSQGKQVVLSADRAPKNIQFDERLKSRFYSGGTIDIQPPEVETKLGIVKSFTDEFSRSEGLGNFTLSDDIQMYIAENSGSNIRELKGAVNTVIYRMIYCDRSDISIDEVRELLAQSFHRRHVTKLDRGGHPAGSGELLQGEP